MQEEHKELFIIVLREVSLVQPVLNEVFKITQLELSLMQQEHKELFLIIPQVLLIAP